MEALQATLAQDLQLDLSGGLFARFLNVFRHGFVFTGDRFGFDPATQRVRALVDWIDPSHACVQTINGQQVAVPSSTSTLLKRNSYVFQGAQRYLSTRPASAFKFLHAGPSYEVAVFECGSSDRMLWSTINFSAVAGKHGALSFYGPTSISRRGYSAGTLVLSMSPTTPFVNGAAGTFAVDYLEGASPAEFHTRGNGAQLSSGNSGGAPSSSDPETTLYVGGHSGGTLFLIGRLALLAATPEVPSAADQAVVSAFCLERYGKAA